MFPTTIKVCHDTMERIGHNFFLPQYYFTILLFPTTNKDLLSIMKQIGYKNFLYPLETKYGIVFRSKSGKCIIFLSLFFVEGFYHSFGTWYIKVVEVNLTSLNHHHRHHHQTMEEVAGVSYHHLINQLLSIFSFYLLFRLF